MLIQQSVNIFIIKLLLYLLENIRRLRETSSVDKR